eukprot:TRINITY_DN15980_c0_g1_i1.p1 TRINITY_DN15980_c0_g1~~TRINITY_DN15980_c0_g1_i1.p1  ORF type:complete len:395 (+),score=64.61 TRINITY_DN15980_c0_g1_i1:742-1926(+)
MLQRTKEFILQQRDGKGGFKCGAGRYAFSCAAKRTSDAYVLYCCTEAGIVEDVALELKHAFDLISSDSACRKDAYYLALTSIALSNCGFDADAAEIAKLLQEVQLGEGNLAISPESVTITKAYGISKQIEITSLAVLAWWKSDNQSFKKNIARGLDYIYSQCDGGRFSSTQGTALALKAILSVCKGEAISSVSVVFNEKNQKVDLLAKTAGEALELELIGEQLQANSNSVQISVEGTNSLPYSLDLSYYALALVSDKACPVELRVVFNQVEFSQGDAVQCDVVVRNTVESSLENVMLAIGIPAGFELNLDTLKDLQYKGVISKSEVLQSNLIIYIQNLAPSNQSTLNFKLDFIARFPGEYISPSHAAYLYYFDEAKYWAKGDTFTIGAASETTH